MKKRLVLSLLFTPILLLAICLSAQSNGRAQSNGSAQSNGTFNNLTVLDTFDMPVNGIPGRAPLVVGEGTAADPVLVFGYNHKSDYTLWNAGEPGLAWMLEGDYDDGSGHNKMEAYLQYLWADGSGKFNRAFATQWDRVTNVPTQTAISGGLGGVSINFLDGTGTPGTQQFVVGNPMALFQPSQSNIYTPLYVRGALQAGGGLTVSGGALYAQSGLTVTGGVLQAGGGMYVYGPVTFSGGPQVLSDSQLILKYAPKSISAATAILESDDTLQPLQLVIYRSAGGSQAYWGLQSVESGVAYRNLALNQHAGSVLVGTANDTGSGAPLQIAGSIQLANATQPTCDATHRGEILYSAGTRGVKDSVEVCAKDASDTYAWRPIY